MKNVKNILSSVLAAIMLLSCFVCPVVANETDVFYDDFSGSTLNTDNWLIAEKSWGGFNGGVVEENVSVSDGTLRLEGHGNYYSGDVEGFNKKLPGGIRTGAAIATREYFGSGSYEVIAKVAPVFGACSAMWTFEYEEYYPGDEEYENAGATGSYYEVNHEIDIEIPGRPYGNAAPSFDYALCNTFTRENLATTNFTHLPYAIDDGQFHTYRFDWHTGDDGETPRVVYYIDGQQICVCKTNIPTNKGRFWLSLWFPCSVDSDNDGFGDTGWTGTANFDTAVFEIDSVKITPFHEAGDTPQRESFPNDGWAADSFPADIEAERFDHVVNGDFSQGKYGWTLSGDAAVSNGAAALTSGAKTDAVSQSISVMPKMTYTLAADVHTDGTEVTIGVRKQNGLGDCSKTVCESGRVIVTFTTESAVNDMELYAQVLRYQSDKIPVTVDNVTLISGTIPAGDSDLPPVSPNPEQPTEPSTEPSTEPKPEQPVVTENLVQNGSFAEGRSFWDLSGSATIENQAARLASGADTDSVSQIIQVEKGQTYTLSADVLSDGAEVIIGVKDYNGRYTKLTKTTSENGRIKLTFTTAGHINRIEVFAEVLRYQSNTAPVIVDNISLVAGTEAAPTNPDVQPPTEPEVSTEPEVPTEPEVSTEPEVPTETQPEHGTNLLVNGTLDTASAWNIVGSAQIANGKAYLASGRDTDIIEQTVELKENTTYRLNADIVSNGVAVDLIVSGYNGKYSSLSKTYTAASNGEIEFTTGGFVDGVRISVRVLRYQEAKDVAVADNITLVQVNN